MWTKCVFVLASVLATVTQTSADSCLTELANAMPVSYPGSADWNMVYPIHNPLYNGGDPSTQPAFVAQPLNTYHIQLCLQCATRNNITVAARAGGHSFAGFSTSTSPSFVISFRLMKNITWVDDSHVTVQPGATWNDVYLNFKERGGLWVLAGGLCPSVGVFGFTFGGGVGPVERRFGMGIDSLVAVEMVLANGTGVVTASEKVNPDLFWAIRGGGGGNFGIVSKMTFTTHTGPVEYSWSKACFTSDNKTTESALKLIAKYAPSLPDHVNLDVDYSSTSGVCYWMIVQGTSSFANQTLHTILSDPLAPVNNLQSLELQQFGCFYELILAYANAKGYNQPSSPFTLKSCFVDSQTLPLLSSYLPSSFAIDGCSANLIQFGGQIARHDATSTAFPWRDAQYMVYVSCGSWTNEDERQRSVKYLKQIYAKLTSRGVCYGAYINFVDPDLEDYEEKYYGVNLQRLKDIKRVWNPTGTSPLRFKQEIIV